MARPLIALSCLVTFLWPTTMLLASFATRLGCSFGKEQSQPPATLPVVHIDGPFGSASEDVFNFEVR